MTTATLPDKMTPSALKTANDLLDHLEPTLGYLASRWEDEKEYEDWKDYDAKMREVVTLKGLTVVKTSKRPFGVTVEIEGFHAQYYMNRRTYGWKRVK